MKTNCRFHSIRTLLIALALAASAAASVADEVIYCARVHSSSSTIWDPPFWWISAGGSGYSIATATSTAVINSRAGSYEHTIQAMSPGEGFGVVCTACSYGPDFVYEVAITQPHYLLSGTDVIFGVCSTNCAIGGLSGGGGYATNTTAFQPACSLDKWGFVCWLTNTAGVPNPEIEFHFVSGTDPNNHYHSYADCVKFTQVCCGGAPTPVRITGVTCGSVAYCGGGGARFTLLRSSTLSALPGSWQPVDSTNAASGSFPIPGGGTGSSMFYRIQSE